MSAGRPGRWRARLRGTVLTVLIRLAGGRCGSRLSVEHAVSFKHPLHSGIVIGDDVILGYATRIDVPTGARVEIGHRVKLTGHCVIAAAERVTIMMDAQVAEFCSIRDADHGVDGDRAVRDQPLRTAPVSIGTDAWIGRGVAVLRGSNVGEGAVVGANSVVTGNVSPGAIAVGAPARVIGRRQSTEHSRRT
jgi:acetyltransferase-like isoleucine patch superfamily enzyme